MENTPLGPTPAKKPGANRGKHTFFSKSFATGPSKLGNVVRQMENQTESQKNQGDHIFQVHARQRNRTQPKTV